MTQVRGPHAELTAAPVQFLFLCQPFFVEVSAAVSAACLTLSRRAECLQRRLHKHKQTF